MNNMYAKSRYFFTKTSLFGLSGFILLTLVSCQNKNESMDKSQEKVRVITLDPGHFHAALLQKSMYGEIDTLVHVYAPEGSEV
jgi:hypothetical protein